MERVFERGNTLACSLVYNPTLLFLGSERPITGSEQNTTLLEKQAVLTHKPSFSFNHRRLPDLIWTVCGLTASGQLSTLSRSFEKRSDLKLENYQGRTETQQLVRVGSPVEAVRLQLPSSLTEQLSSDEIVAILPKWIWSIARPEVTLGVEFTSESAADRLGFVAACSAFTSLLIGAVVMLG